MHDDSSENKVITAFYSGHFLKIFALGASRVDWQVGILKWCSAIPKLL